MKWKFPSFSATATATATATRFAVAVLLTLIACTPTVRLQAPDEPIRFDVNVNVTEEKRVQIDQAVLDLIQKNPQLFGFEPGEVPGKEDGSAQSSSESSQSRSESK